MKHIQHSIRLELALDEALKRHAKAKNISAYSLLQQSVKVGLSTILGGEDLLKTTNQIATQIGALNARIVHLEKLIERTLYVACAAYSYSRIATSSHKIDEAKINHEIQQAFNRQINLTGGFDEQ